MTPSHPFIPILRKLPFSIAFLDLFTVFYTGYVGKELSSNQMEGSKNIYK